MKWTLSPLFLAAAVAIAADDKPKDQPSAEALKEVTRFQGEWTAEKIVTNGKEVPAGELKDMRLTIAGNKRILKAGDQVKAESTFEVDPTTSPRGIVVTVSAGPLKGKKLAGIYELTDDTLTMCMNPKGPERPKELASKPGSGYQLQQFKRVTK